LDAQFEAAGWDTNDGRYRKGEAWVRITFRHQMSLGSDFIDAIRLAKKDGVSHLVIAAASREFLEVISPNDAGALISFEKLVAQTAELNGAIDIPLFLGRLTPISELPPEVEDALLRQRPRDEYRPS
jgi:hypothetical protein